MPRRSFPCAVCGEPMRPGSNSLPEGQARHKKCASKPAREVEDTEPVFGPRAQRLHDGLCAGVTDPARLALADEAARLADRLDNLDSIIRGKGVLNLMRFRLRDAFDSAEEKRVQVVVSFDGVLSETRQQAVAFRQILTTLAIAGAPAAAATPASESPTKETALDELERRRAARVPGAASSAGPGV